MPFHSKGYALASASATVGSAAAPRPAAPPSARGGAGCGSAGPCTLQRVHKLVCFIYPEFLAAYQRVRAAVATSPSRVPGPGRREAGAGVPAAPLAIEGPGMLIDARARSIRRQDHGCRRSSGTARRRRRARSLSDDELDLLERLAQARLVAIAAGDSTAHKSADSAD